MLIAADGPIDAGRRTRLRCSIGDQRAGVDAGPPGRAGAAGDASRGRAGRARQLARPAVGTAAASFDPQYVAPQGLFQPGKSWRFTVSFTQEIFEGGQHKIDRQLR